MIRGVLQQGTIQLLGPVPADWREGQVLVIEPEPEERDDETSALLNEIDRAAQEIPAEDHARFLESLAEQRTASKELVRRQMGR